MTFACKTQQNKGFKDIKQFEIIYPFDNFIEQTACELAKKTIQARPFQEPSIEEPSKRS